jgi:aspartate/methionine/tyrosine aminotransferase
LHLLVDEVYANQVFSSSIVPNPPPFISILSLDVQSLVGCDPSRIHVIAGPTKDFGASGLKVGAFVSQHNSAMIRMMTASLGAFPVSSASDAALTPVMNDTKYCKWFLEENRRRLSEAFETVASWCTFHHVP